MKHFECANESEYIFFKPSKNSFSVDEQSVMGESRLAEQTDMLIFGILQTSSFKFLIKLSPNTI